MLIDRHLGAFTGALAPLLPADFAAAVRALDLASARPAPRRLPVCRFWDQVVAAEGAGAGRCWRPWRRWAPRSAGCRTPITSPPRRAPISSRTTAMPCSPGPGGLVASDALALGVLMLGPGIHYPTHRHPAVEIYVVAAGEAEWQKGEEPWRREPPGTVIRHESMMPHATRTLAEPLLAAYLWRGDLATHARIIASPANPRGKFRIMNAPLMTAALSRVAERIPARSRRGDRRAGPGAGRRGHRQDPRADHAPRPYPDDAAGAAAANCSPSPSPTRRRAR